VDEAQKEEQGYMLHFIAWSTTSGISLRSAREPEFRVCISGRDSERARAYTRRGVLTWLRAVWVIDDRVTNQVTFECNNSHMRVNILPGSGTSNASPGRTNIYEQRPYGTYLHEFGHSLAGLADTYSGRQAGRCQAGQPQSNMCWGAYGPRSDPERFSGLWQDDIEGVQSQYRKIFRDSRPPANGSSVDLKAPLNVENPWPISGGESDNSSRKTKIAIKGGRSDSKQIFLSSGHEVNKVYYCFGVSQDKCRPDTPQARSAVFVRNAGERIIYRLTQQYEVSDPTILSFYLEPASSLAGAFSYTEQVKIVRQ